MTLRAVAGERSSVLGSSIAARGLLRSFRVLPDALAVRAPGANHSRSHGLGTPPHSVSTGPRNRYRDARALPRGYPWFVAEPGAADLAQPLKQCWRLLTRAEPNSARGLREHAVHSFTWTRLARDLISKAGIREASE